MDSFGTPDHGDVAFNCSGSDSGTVSVDTVESDTMNGPRHRPHHLQKRIADTAFEEPDSLLAKAGPRIHWRAEPEMLCQGHK